MIVVLAAGVATVAVANLILFGRKIAVPFDFSVSDLYAQKSCY
jgi:hypothetical protein